MKKLTIAVPDEVFQKLTRTSINEEKSLSSIVSMSVEYYCWLLEQQNKGARILVNKKENGRELYMEINIK